MYQKGLTILNQTYLCAQKDFTNANVFQKLQQNTFGINYARTLIIMVKCNNFSFNLNASNA